MIQNCLKKAAKEKKYEVKTSAELNATGRIDDFGSHGAVRQPTPSARPIGGDEVVRAIEAIGAASRDTLDYMKKRLTNTDGG